MTLRPTRAIFFRGGCLYTDIQKFYLNFPARYPDPSRPPRRRKAIFKKKGHCGQDCLYIAAHYFILSPRACARVHVRVRPRVRVYACIRAWVCALHSRERTRAPGSCYLWQSPGECANQLSGTRCLTCRTNPGYLWVTGEQVTA